MHPSNPIGLQTEGRGLFNKQARTALSLAAALAVVSFSMPSASYADHGPGLHPESPFGTTRESTSQLKSMPLKMGSDSVESSFDGLSLPCAQPKSCAWMAKTAPTPQDNLSVPPALTALKRVTYRIKPGDTLSKLLVRYKLSDQDRKLWLAAVQKRLPAGAFRPGRNIQFYFAPPATSTRQKKPAETLKAFEIDLNEDSTLAWEKGTKGIVYSKRDKPYDVELKTVGGVVERSFFEDGLRVGLNETVLSQLADIFSWEVDFEKDIRKGDTFKVVYEQRSRKGNESKAAFRIMAAELMNAGRRYFAIYFEKDKGQSGYYDLDGRSLARAFLRFPLEFTKISSAFAHSRLHPILGVDRPHNGVDLAAKKGTQVRAVGDGTIRFAGWRRGGYGRMIDIQHDSSYSTRYAHLLRVATGLRSGSTIKKGQLIGYVGSSGLSNGSHLHFELYKNGDYIDPLSFEFPAEDQIEPALLKVFETRKQLFLAEMAAAPNS